MKKGVYGRAQTLSGHHGGASYVTYNRKGTYCLSTGYDKTIKLWNPEKGTLVKTYTGHSYEVLGVDCTQDNSQIVTCGKDKQVFCWDVTSGKVVRKFRGHDSTVNVVCYNEDCSVVVTGSYDRTVKLWDCKARTYDPIQTLTEARDSVSDVCVRGHEVVSGSVDGGVRTYDIRAGRLRTDGISAPVVSVCLSNDGNCLLAGTLESCALLLDKSDGEVLQSYKGHQAKEYKSTCCFNHTDAHVLSGSEDGSVCVWEIVEGRLLQQAGHPPQHTAMQRHQLTLSQHAPAHRRAVSALSHHPTRRAFIAASLDGQLSVWVGV